MIRVDEQKCIGCGLCVKDCIANNIVLEETDAGTKKAKVKKDCFECGHCVAICPMGAFEAEGYDMSEIREIKDGKGMLDADALLDAISFRRSVRDYKAKKVEREKLEKMAEAVRYTATAKNNQDTFVVFVQEQKDAFQQMVWDYIESIIPEKRTEIPRDLLPFAGFLRQRKANSANDFLFRNAPVVAFITSDWILDPGMAAQNMELVANAQGLGVLYNGFLAGIVNRSEELKNWLGISGKQIKGCLLVGYPAVKYHRTVPRKPANSIWR